jgi:hypothetical protein
MFGEGYLLTLQRRIMMARTPNKELWAKPEFKALLDAKGNLTPDGLKLIVENQRQINTRLYEGLRALFYDHPLLKAYEEVKKIPGDGPPGCSYGSGGGSGSGSGGEGGGG